MEVSFKILFLDIYEQQKRLQPKHKRKMLKVCLPLELKKMKKKEEEEEEE
jgi:hypothetical protein